MIVLCASYIITYRRLKYLDNMLQSWHNQTESSKLYISISYAEDMMEDVYILLKKWKYIANDAFVYSPKNVRFSQFEHYESLLSEFKDEFEPLNEWIMFTDDDDLWNINRIQSYKQFLYDFRNVTNDAFCIHNSIICYYTNDTIQEIDLEKCTNDGLEYVDYCIRYTSILKAIADAKDFSHISNNYFDLQFGPWVRQISDTYIRLKKHEWLYLHRYYDK